MEVHDYEYYEANAKDVKLEDITSDDDNADILAKIRDNDPEKTYFGIDNEDDDDDFLVREGDHLGWLGYFVGENDRLRELYIGDSNNINLNAFLRGLGHNRSIQFLTIGTDLGESFQSLVLFLRNNDNLHDLTFNGFGIGLQCARNIKLLLGQNSSLKCLTFSEETGLDDEKLAQIAVALRSQPQIEELRLSSNNMVKEGYVALGNALEGCPNLRKLDLEVFQRDDGMGTGDGNISNEGLVALAEGLKHCHNLTSLNLYGDLMISEQVSRSLSTLFTSDNCRLEHLDLDKMNIDDDGMAVLATGLASLSSLKRLYLRRMSTGDQGLQDLLRALVNCNLEELCLSHNMLLDSVSGMRALGTFVRRTKSMNLLNLIDSPITDEGLQSFVEGMANCCSLTDLYISNRSITSNGLTSLSSLLRTEDCMLSDLDLHGINIGDDGAAALANGLIGNNSLTELGFSPTDSGITARGWDAFSRLLCDTSSVNNTYLSNHTLVQIGEYKMDDTPLEIVKYLNLNESQYHGAAAICKILHSYPDIDVTPLFEFNLEFLPLVVEWFENAKPCIIDRVNEPIWRWEILHWKIEHRQLSAVYKFIRGLPLLAANGYRSQKVISKKRKLNQTL